MNDFDKKSAIYRAKEIIDELKIEKPSHIDITAIAMNRGTIIIEDNLEGADGRLAVIEDKGLITIRNSIKEYTKKRFVMAHELGHYELHRRKVFTKSCTDSDFLKWIKGNPIEIEANYFASEILMPEEMFNEKIEGQDITLNLIKKLSTEFNVSWTAASIRFVTLRPEYALIFSENSIIKWFVIDSDYFSWFVNTHGKVHSESIAFDCFRGDTVPTKLVRVETSAWIESNTKIRGTLKELTVPLGSYGVLSFLYVEEWDEY
jgi:Zn-dependent peptidase ImmA (M78 family)